MQNAKNWFRGLSRTGKIAVTSVAVLIGLGTAGSFAEPGGQQPVESEKDAKLLEVKSEPNPPVVTTKQEKVTVDIPYKSSTIEDASLTKGATQVETAGVDGVRTKTYSVTYTDGEETDRKLISNKVTKPAVNEVMVLGTYVKPKPVPAANCDPNYSGCVPIASDVDCAGGSGNGPAYAYGPVNVVGYDIYDLDGDGDGVGCE